MKANFDNTVSILVKAYFDGTLEKDNCYACAVGNIVDASNGFTFERCDKGGRKFKWSQFESLYSDSVRHPIWTDVFFMRIYGKQEYRPENLKGKVKIQISNTGYTVNQLMAIERAFENSNDEFDGLMSVVDQLAEIHNIDLESKEEAKKMFVKI